VSAICVSALFGLSMGVQQVVLTKLHRADMLSDAGKYAEAEKMYLEFIERRPQLAGAYYNLGRMYWQAERLTEADEAFKKALRLSRADLDGSELSKTIEGALSSLAVEIEHADSYLTLVKSSGAYLDEMMERFREDFRIDDWENFYYDQDTAIFEFLSNGNVKVRAKLQVVGTYSLNTKTWLWSWANDAISPQSKREIERVQRYGLKKHFEKLFTRKWTATEEDGWEMTSIAAKLLRAKGAYRVPSEHLRTFFIFSEVTKVN
jgi:tetratricopeptide (TPR) repeat protein